MWCLIIACTFIISAKCIIPPHIFLILADDLGWNDISLHGQKQFWTENIDALGMNGITLNRHYVGPLCTPSRAALMTGRDGYHTGMFHYVIDSDEPWGMPLTEKTLPEVLKTKDYSTHLVGKWHLGFFKSEYAPTNRGFDSYHGFLGPYIDYYDYTLQMPLKLLQYGKGYDMRKNLQIDPSNGTYATDLFTNKAVQLINEHNTSKPMFMVLSHVAPHAASQFTPLQAPESEIAKFGYMIAEPARMVLAAMISRLDYSVGQLVKTLKERCMLDNSIILFMADNGAPTVGPLLNFGSNYPLRSQKDSPFEGATRGAAVIFSPHLKQRQRVSNQYIHITDWFKTFARLAGVDTDTVKPNLDGYDVWDALSNNSPSPRTEIVQNINNVSNYAAFISGQYKYIEGTANNGTYDTWFKPELGVYKTDDAEYAEKIRNSEVGKALLKYANLAQTTTYVCSSEENQIALNNSKIISLRNQAKVVCNQPLIPSVCVPSIKPCLFDIIADPCEYNNLAFSNKAKLKEMQDRLAVLRSTAVPALNQEGDPNANPSLNDNTWTYWQDA